jgi:hypothetical protein
MQEQAACILVQHHLARVVQRMLLYRDCSSLVQHPQGLQIDAHAMMQLPKRWVSQQLEEADMVPKR